MATVDRVSLNVDYRAVPEHSAKATVTVGYTLTFAAPEERRDFRLGIDLFGRDVTSTPVRSPLYSFGWPWPIGRGLVLSRGFTIVQAVVGEHAFQETREIEMSVLDEDPGFYYFCVPGPEGSPPVCFRRAFGDEVFAIVRLWYEVESRSNTVEMEYLPITV